MSNKKLVLIGGGGHGKSVLDSIIQSDSFSQIVITDHSLPVGALILGHTIVGNDEMLPELFERGYRHAFIAIGSIKSTDKRRNLCLRAGEIGYSYPTVIDPSAAVSVSARIGKGVYIGKNAVVNAGAVVGDQAIINSGAIVEHDCKIGEFTHIAVGATVCGGTEIGNDVFVGANATVIQEIKIGMNSIIGAGSIVLNDVPEYARIVGMGANRSLKYERG